MTDRQRGKGLLTSVANRTEFAMQSTVDLEWQTEDYSGEDVTTSALQRGPPMIPGFLLPFRVATLVFGVLGLLSNVLVMSGLWLAGRSKLNASSAYIANHTTLEQRPTP